MLNPNPGANSINNDDEYYSAESSPLDSDVIIIPSADRAQRVHYSLPTLRFTNIVQTILVVDALVSIVLWLTGGNSAYFLTNVVRFHFTESVFDLAVMAAVKTILLVPLYSYLENTANRLIDNPFTPSYSTIISSTITALASVKFLFLIFSVTKGGMILYSLLHTPTYPGMHPTYYALTVSAIVFGVVEFGSCLFSYSCLERLAYMRVYHRVNCNGEKVQDERKVNILRLARLAKEEKWILTVAGIAMFGSCGSQMVTPLFLGKIIDAATHSIDDLNNTVLMLLGIFLFGAIVSMVRSWCFALAGQRFVARLRKLLFAAVVKQDVSFFDQSRTGELCNRLSSDTQVLQGAVTSNVSQLVRYSLQVVGSLALMLYLNASLTGVLLAVVPVVVIGTVQYGKYVQKLRQRFQDRLADAGTVAEETLSSIRTVRMFSAEPRSIQGYSGHIDDSYREGKKLALAQGVFDSVVFFMANCGVTVIIWYGGKLVLENTHDSRKGVTPGVLTAFLMFTLNVAMAISLLSSVYSNFMQAVGASIRIFSLLDREPRIPTDSGIEPLALEGAVEFRDVYFTYPARPDCTVLRGVTFRVDPGEVVALVGPSGGGKSTIVSLIERFYDPPHGAVSVGGFDLKLLNPSWFRERLAMVSQEPTLFATSIRDNIAYGRPASDGEIIEAARQANAHNFIMSFEAGYDTLVGERGVSLSGGQKQRIAIARALIMNPSILLLDEATSALDAESEHLVQEAIDRAMKGRTVIVIAHRLSTVRNATQVMVIDHGRIIEKGTHSELLSYGGVYKRLVLRQLLTSDSQDADNIPVTLGYNDTPLVQL